MTTRSAFRLFVLAAAGLSACDRAPEAAAPRTTFAVPANWPHSLSAPDVTATHGIVVSDAPLASRVGGVTLAMIAQQLEAYDLARLGWHSVPAIHVQAEAMRRAFAVRNDLLGDAIKNRDRARVDDHAGPQHDPRSPPRAAARRSTARVS